MNTSTSGSMWTPTLDVKGRLYLPAEFLAALGHELVFAVANTRAGRALTVTTRAAWEQREAEYGTRLDWWRLEGSTAVRVSVGSHRRVAIPLHLRQLFGLRAGEDQAVRHLGPTTAEVLPLAQWREEQRRR